MTWPSRGSSATTAPGCSPSACSASCCTRMSSVSRMSEPAAALRSAITRTGQAFASMITSCPPRRPASDSSQLRSIPSRPTRSPER